MIGSFSLDRLLLGVEEEELQCLVERELPELSSRSLCSHHVALLDCALEVSAERATWEPTNGCSQIRVACYSQPVTPEEAQGFLAQQAGGVLGRFALGDESVSHENLYDAVSFSLVSSAESFEQAFDPRNHFLAELFVTP